MPYSRHDACSSITLNRLITKYRLRHLKLLQLNTIGS